MLHIASSFHLIKILIYCEINIIQVISENDPAPAGCAVSVVNESLSVYLELQGTLSPEAELEKIRKKTDEIRK
jgi:valyl-tRNA synthetase